MQNLHSRYVLYTHLQLVSEVFINLWRSLLLCRLLPCAAAGHGAGCSCTAYQVLCDWQGTTEPALRTRQNEATWDSTSTIHLPSSATAKVTGYSHRRCDPRSISGTVHPLPQMSVPGRLSAAAYPNTGYGSQLIHAQPCHSICGTLLKGLKKMKTQHINWMTLKMGSLGIPRSAVAETIVGGEQRGELCVDTREASFWQGPRAAAASTDTSLSGFICYILWATWRKLYGWATLVDHSSGLRAREYLLAPPAPGTTGEKHLQNVNPQLPL